MAKKFNKEEKEIIERIEDALSEFQEGERMVVMDALRDIADTIEELWNEED